MINPVVSIIICTRDRAADLRGTLAAIGQTCVSEEMPCELVIVDNASTDNTKALVKSTCLPNILVRYIHEAQQGKGYAYNAGLATARGQVLLFTDDDVRPPQSWIAGMVGPILRGAVDAVAGGVRFAPYLVRPWMWDSLRAGMADTSFLDTEAPDYMVGANMAFSREVLEKVPAFDTELGPGGLGFADEVLFSYQLKAAGFRIGAALETAVEHHFDPARLSRLSLLDAAKKHGRSQAYVAYHWDHQGISMPQIRLAKCIMRQTARRARRPQTLSEEGIPRWEFEDVKIIEFYKAYLRESRRPHCYDRHGLVKHTLTSKTRQTA